MINEKLVIILPNIHRVYFGWFKYLIEKFRYLYLAVPENSRLLNIEKIGIKKENIIFLENKSKVLKEYMIKLEGLKKVINGVEPDVILSKIVFQPYTVDSFKLSIKKGIDFLIFDELKVYPENLLLKIPFKFYLNHLKKLYKEVPIIGVTKLAYEFISNEYR